jgi:hypothetical protein
MERWSRLVVFLAFGVGASPALARVQSVTATAVRLVRFEEAPIIDGHIDEVAWTNAARINAFARSSPATTSSHHNARKC